MLGVKIFSRFQNNLFSTVYSRIIQSKAAQMSTVNVMQKKYLAAFDFDCTIADGFSDNIVRDLLPQNHVPAYKDDGWISYMEKIFKLLQTFQVQESDIKCAVHSLKPVSGMFELLMELTANPDFDVIIISDGNSYFINIWLEHYKVNNIKKIITNPAYYHNGSYNIKMYKPQDTCDLSEKSLCIVYKPVVYVGDGFNDFCPVLRLKSGDLACCRAGFECADAVKSVQEGQKIENIMYNIQADTLFWKSGFDILDSIKPLIGIKNKDIENC